MMLALFGTAAPSTLRDWFACLCEGSRVIDNLQTRPGAHPMGKSSTVTDSTGPSGSRTTRTLSFWNPLRRAHQGNLHGLATETLRVVDPGFHPAVELLSGPACEIERVIDSILPDYTERGLGERMVL
jgi:hypothetical protein